MGLAAYHHHGKLKDISVPSYQREITKERKRQCARNFSIGIIWSTEKKNVMVTSFKIKTRISSG